MTVLLALAAAAQPAMIAPGAMRGQDVNMVRESAAPAKPPCPRQIRKAKPTKAKRR